MEASSVKELSEIAKAIADKNKELGKYAYKRITIDNGTKLEEMILPLALQLYRETPKQPMGRILETLCVKLLNCWKLLIGRSAAKYHNYESNNITKIFKQYVWCYDCIIFGLRD